MSDQGDVEPTQAKMVPTIDDALQVVREMPPPANEDEKRCLTLFHKENDLRRLLSEFVQAGTFPGVSLDAGRVTALKLELNKYAASSKRDSSSNPLLTGWWW